MNGIIPKEKYLRPEEVCRILKVTTRTLFNWEKQENLEPSEQMEDTVDTFFPMLDPDSPRRKNPTNEESATVGLLPRTKRRSGKTG